jgi:hypothetical protein
MMRTLPAYALVRLVDSDKGGCGVGDATFALLHSRRAGPKSSSDASRAYTQIHSQRLTVVNMFRQQERSERQIRWSRCFHLTRSDFRNALYGPLKHCVDHARI